MTAITAISTPAALAAKSSARPGLDRADENVHEYRACKRPRCKIP
jgi:hypothetical protein